MQTPIVIKGVMNLHRGMHDRQKKPGCCQPGFESFGRGCLKGTFVMSKSTLLCKCEKLTEWCIARNCYIYDDISIL
jgi:hypothetical protein